MQPNDFARLMNNFYIQKGLESNIDRINLDGEVINYFNANQKSIEQRYKVAFVFICLNPLYWQYAPAMVQGAKNLFLPGHNTDFFFWTDIPEDGWKIHQNITQHYKEALLRKGINQIDNSVINEINRITDEVIELRKRDDVYIIPTESIEWPYPTLLRYNLFLQEEQKLKEYDYIFYLDVDMQFVGIVGDEILPKEGLMACQHPMYALKKEYWPPYEPNTESASYVKRPGRLIDDGGKPRFMPIYFAGGFQGGKSDKFIEAMKVCRDLTDKDLNRQYIPIWNDESVWNKYLSENPPEVILTPSYIYPDSLIKEYYIPLWGQDYNPKIKTLTKWFTTSKEGGKILNKIVGQ